MQMRLCVWQFWGELLSECACNLGPGGMQGDESERAPRILAATAFLTYLVQTVVELSHRGFCAAQRFNTQSFSHQPYLYFESAFIFCIMTRSAPWNWIFLHKLRAPVKCALTVSFVTAVVEQLINIQMSSAEHLVTHLTGFIVRSIETLRWNANFSTVSHSLGVCYLESHREHAHSIFHGSELSFFLIKGATPVNAEFSNWRRGYSFLSWYVKFNHLLKPKFLTQITKVKKLDNLERKDIIYC